MSQGPSIRSLYMVVLMQENLEAALAFYQTLGLRKIFYIPEKWAELEIQGVRIGLCPTAKVEKGNHTGIVFEVHDMQTVHDQLLAQGAEFATAPVTATHGIMASCFDPSGNKIDLYQPTHHKVKEVLDEAQKGGCCTQEKEEAQGGCSASKSSCC
jgi:predicted enzyme related to lactoylglutathione lyase